MKNILAISTAALITMLLAGSVLATISYPTPILNPPANAGTQVLDISFQVANDEDSGVAVGYWALDSYTKTVTVWTDTTNPTTGYVAYVSYLGTFCTFAGATSPQNGVTQSNDGCGTMSGGYDATFTSESGLQSSTTATSYDFGGTKADVLAGTWTHQTLYDWVDAYFPDAQNFDQPVWSWTYSLPTGALGGTQWINDGNGNSGDIVTGSSNVVLTATVSTPVCGLSAAVGSGSTLSFGSLVADKSSSGDDYVTLSGSGNTPLTGLAVYGNNWIGSQYPTIGNAWMPVGATSVKDGVESSFISLTDSTNPISLTNALANIAIGDWQTNANSGSANVYFQLTIPSGQVPDAYTQTITFASGC
jgi:hypothetical protein